ncbi:restriction endonuclease subunit S [Acinetobacter baumannii]|nr:restriction endonuclease subunit S [Acinetobacter baumannii]
MAKYQAYAEYKDSGVEWLGVVPSHWIITTLKRYCYVKGGFAFSSDAFIDTGYPVIRIGDIKTDGSINLENCKYIPESLAVNSRDYLVEKNQLLMAMTGATIGKAGLYTSNQPAFLNQRVGKFELLAQNMNYRYLWYILKTDGYQEYIKLTAFGGAQPNISDTAMVDYPATIPSFDEQTQIANFLDHETSKIDHLIEKQQKLIELLKEKRQAVISHAVTKGLDPNVPMKDSGVAWLGEVPQNWTATKIGFHALKIGSGKTPKGGAEIYQDEGVLFIRSQNVYNDGLRVDNSESVYISEAIHDEMSTSKIYSGDILLNITGGSIGRSSLVPDKFPEANVNQHVCIIRVRKYLQEFLALVIQSDLIQAQLRSIQTGGNREGLNFEQISKFWFVLPPKDEQEQIILFIKNKLNEFGKLEARANKAIQLMQERRTALISAAVTGKIDVRHWQSPTVAEADTELSA